MNMRDGTANHASESDLIQIGHRLSTALFNGDLDQCIEIILVYGKARNYAFSDRSRSLLEKPDIKLCD
ncbi:hypothetical protein [uncultured Cohaesibacter sp.]|uniref:hypothetical protein n=1 Tax=uncultured Cohaesibacter sp. TaxID=1002546 RepID=UPI0029C99C65|nr:hypothetical protein [uncultured Cohaesibacter sp.]